VELLRILLGHPGVVVDAVFAGNSAGMRVDELYPDLRGRCDLVYAEYDPNLAAASGLVFVALPSGHAMTIAPDLLDRGTRVIDLGGDFRLRNPDEYEQFYKKEHLAPELLAGAVYGLPELHRTQIATARLVSNPGCYPTSAILPLAPLLERGLVDPECITISSMSGTSGAGRTANVDYSFSECYGNVRAYRVADHQHLPEICGALRSLAGSNVSISFIPHLIPVARGIYSTITAPTVSPIQESDLTDLYATAYGSAPFVRYATGSTPEMRGVVGTNYIDIGAHVDRGASRVVLLSTIDNLVKGAAGQAVQNMNIMAGFAETEGLL